MVTTSTKESPWEKQFDENWHNGNWYYKKPETLGESIISQDGLPNQEQRAVALS